MQTKISQPRGLLKLWKYARDTLANFKQAPKSIRFRFSSSDDVHTYLTSSNEYTEFSIWNNLN